MNEFERHDSPQVTPGEHPEQAHPEAGSATPRGPGPGQRLREAREARRLTRADAARQLHLDVRMITALEEDDRENMPPAIYVSGYLRSYARLLHLPEDEIAASYGGAEEQPSLVPNIDLKPQARGSDTVVRAVTYALVFGLLALLVLWWFGVGKQRTPPPPAGASAAAPAESSANTARRQADIPGTAAPSGESHQPGTSGAPVTTDARKPPLTADSHAESAADVSAPGSASDSHARGTAPQTGSTPGQASTVSSPHITATPPSGRSAVQLGGMPRHLRLTYTADSWTEVYDSAGRQLIYRLVRAGESLDLVGTPPFNVRLGYAPGVAIEYNGKPFDTGRSNSKDVAHFIVGKSAAAGNGDG